MESSGSGYRLILVDDEAIVREGIANCVAWGENGFELAGLFEHGAAALEYIEHHAVDVVISDINMPRMDGLTLSAVLTERFPSIMVLLLTGYDDFEYAQQAVRNQVRQFLLKPITAAELSSVLSGVREELDLQRHRERQQELMQEKLRLSFPLLKERFLYRLVTGRIEAEQLARRRDYVQWRDLGHWYQVLLVRIPGDWTDLDRITLQEYLRGQAGEWDEIFQNSEENIVMLTQERSPELLELHSRELARRGFLEPQPDDKERVSVGCGEIVARTDELHRSYAGAATALDYSRVMGVSQIFSIGDIRDLERISPENFNSLMRSLVEQLKEGHPRATKEALQAVFRYLEEHYLPPEEASHYLDRLHLELLYFVSEIGLFPADSPELTYRPENFASLPSAADYFSDLIDSIEAKIADRRHEMLESRIDKAKAIIASRYRESEFSLRDICNELYLSTSQFSHLFKEGTGQTFVEYLTAFRVEEAKRLLKTTDLKGYEIAERVGYTDPRYFSIIFKKQTGTTAMAYRRSLEL